MPEPSADKVSPPPLEIQIPMPVVVKFVRQLAHDLRNHLNAAELQSAYLAEIVEGAEAKGEIKRLRAMISEAGANLQSVTNALSAARLTEMPYPATDFMEDLQQKLAADFPQESAKIKWDAQTANANLSIDPQLLLPALIELFANAFRHNPGDGAISAEAKTDGEHFVFTIREPKLAFEHSTENWGREPLRTIRQGHYGLGLYRARGIVEAHQGKLEAHFDDAAACLITTVTLPLAPPG